MYVIFVSVRSIIIFGIYMATSKQTERQTDTDIHTCLAMQSR